LGSVDVHDFRVGEALFTGGFLGMDNLPRSPGQAQADAWREKHGFNDPIPVQYVRWLTGILTRGDFGHSFYYNKPVGDVVAERLPATILLALTCHILASIFGITLGIVAATRQYSWADTLLGFIAFLGMTIPRFLLAIIILYILVFRLNVSEVGMFFSARYGGAPWSWDKFVNLVQHVWPVVLIATFGGLAYNMRVMRGNLLDVLNAFGFAHIVIEQGEPQHLRIGEALKQLGELAQLFFGGLGQFVDVIHGPQGVLVDRIFMVEIMMHQAGFMADAADKAAAKVGQADPNGRRLVECQMHVTEETCPQHWYGLQDMNKCLFQQAIV
jgi:hypothetical protein